MKSGSDFIKHLLRRKKQRLKKDDIVTSKYQNNKIEHIKSSKVDIEEENKQYILKGAKVEQFKKSPIEIIKERNIIDIKKNDETVVKAKLEESVIKKIEQAINKNEEFEIKIEDINEKKIRKELTSLIKKDKNETNKINEELDEISKKATIYKKVEEIKELEKRINEIKKRLDTIKKHYEVISEYYEFKGYGELKNTILINSIEDYKFYQNQTAIDKLVIDCKEECKRLDTIIEVTDKCIKADEKVLEVKKYNEKRDEEYLKSREKIKAIDETYDKINKNMKEQNEFLEKLNKDMIVLEYRLKSDEFYENTNRVFDNLLKVSVATYLIPFFPPISIMIQAVLLDIAIRGLSSSLALQKKKEFVSKKVIEKYINILYENKSNLDLVQKLLTDNLSNLKELRKEYVDKFGQFSETFDDYKINLNKIDQSISKLEEKNENMKIVQRDLKEKSVKVLKLR